MKIAKLLLAAAVLLSCAGFIPASAQKSANPFLGRWDLTLKSPDHEYPSWIEITEKDGKLSALFTSRWGNARPLPKIEIAGTKITFVSPKEEEDRKEDMLFTGTLAAGKLSGKTTGQDGTPWTWTAVRAPSLKRAAPPTWGDPISIFNGKDLTGWHESGAGKTHWTVKDGNLVTPGNGPELIGEKKFQDFKLHL